MAARPLQHSMKSNSCQNTQPIGVRTSVTLGREITRVRFPRGETGAHFGREVLARLVGRWQVYWLVLLVCITLSACRPQQPVLTPKVARVVAVSAKGLDLVLTLDVMNPNEFPLSARKVSGTLFVGDGQKLGTGQSTPEQSIPARGSATLESQVQVAWTDLSALTQFVGKSEVPYTFTGDVTLGSDDFQLDLPFTLTGTLTRGQLLQAGLRGIFDP
jgi:LEA14-like dessication related protein